MTPRKYWASAPEAKTGPLSRTQFLIFELGRECNFGKAHHKCPNMHPERFTGLNTERELTDDVILECAIRAYTEFGFGGLIGWHYYNEPTLQAERLTNDEFTGLMDRIEMATSEARFVLWSNHSNPEWIQLHRHRFAQIHGYNYHDDPKGEKLDDRIVHLEDRSNRPCMRAWTEFILDAYGNHHPCCFDWRGEASLGNVSVDGFPKLLERWEEFQNAVGIRAMTETAPEACRRYGHRQSGLTRFDEESARRAEEMRRRIK